MGTPLVRQHVTNIVDQGEDLVVPILALLLPGPLLSLDRHPVLGEHALGSAAELTAALTALTAALTAADLTTSLSGRVATASVRARSPLPADEVPAATADPKPVSSQPASTSRCPDIPVRKDDPPMGEDPVATLMTHARDSDQQAWDALVERHAPLI